MTLETIDREFIRRGLKIKAKLQRHVRLRQLQQPCEDVLNSLGVIHFSYDSNRTKVLISLIEHPYDYVEVGTGTATLKPAQWATVATPVGSNQLRRQLSKLEQVLSGLQ